MTATAQPTAKVDLAHEPDFWLGGLLVRPSALHVRAAGYDEQLQPRLMEVLVLLARTRNRTVTRDELIEACWGGRFVGDDAIDRVISKLRDLARSLEPPPFTLQTVPKVGFRLSSPEPVDVDLPDAARDRDSATSGRRAGGRVRWRAALVIGLAAMLLAVLGGWVLWRVADGGTPDRPAGQNGRVEVMLFEPLRPDPALQRFSVALGDAVVRVLSGNGIETAQRPLRRDVASPTGTAEVRVAGTVDQDGGKYVVNAQVIDRASGGVLWSGRIDRPAGAATAFHEEAANRVGDILHCALTHRAASNRPMTPAVFGMLLNACEARRAKDPAAYTRLMEITRKFVEAAPDLSVAHSMHAMAIALVGANMPPSQAAAIGAHQAEARASAGRALKLDPGNGEAHFALALNYGFAGRWREREQHFLRAAELSPDLSVVRNYYAQLLRQVGREEEARAVNIRTIAADPFSPWQLSRLASMMAAAGDLAGAEALMERIELLDPETARARRFQVALWWDDPERGRMKLRALGGERTLAVETACFDQHLARVARLSGSAALGLPAECDGVQPDMRIRMLARQGDVDGAYAELTRWPLPDDVDAAFLFFPEMRSVRHDPRFMMLASQVGLVDYWTKTGRWPDFCREPDLPYDCRKAAAAL